MFHVVMFSSGIGSWAAGKLVAQQEGTEKLILLNADTKQEDEDTYAWGEAAAKNIGVELTTIADGRDVWQVFFDERYLGNTRVDPCSRILKRELCRKWVENKFKPEQCLLYVGIHIAEKDRMPAIQFNWQPYEVRAPLCEPPLMGYQELHAWAEREGLWKQRLYQLGFPHANCGGFCVKAGQAHFKRLLETMPERYAYHERREQELREFLGKDVSILRDRRGGMTKPLTLKAFRERIEAGKTCDLFDWGGCSCFAELTEKVNEN